MTRDEELAALRARIEQLEKANKPLDWAALDREAALWRDQMHQASEARMARFSNFSREDLRAFEAATPTETCRDLWQHGTTPSPSGAGVSGQVTKVSRNAGLPGSNTGGWGREIPLGPQPGINHIDRLMAAEDMEFRRQRMLEEAQRQAMLKDQT
jgi:hypothetical protein